MENDAVRLARPSVPKLDDILGDTLKVLDDGFIRVVDYMGSDESIVQAARVSYGKGTKHVSDDRGLIRYLMRHGHTTPFEMCELKLHVRAPMDCWRQWIRHRTASVNEYSTRYSEAIDAAQKTPTDGWRWQAVGNKQGGDLPLDPSIGTKLTEAEGELHRHSREVYEARLKAGVAREQARKDLPLSTYTEAYWKIDLHNLFHFLQVRMDSHAQIEIRTYANMIGTEVVARWCPIAWEAFTDYRLEAIKLTRLESEIVRAIASTKPEEAVQIAIEHGLLSGTEHPLSRNRERDELAIKLDRLGMKIPWND